MGTTIFNHGFDIREKIYVHTTYRVKNQTRPKSSS